MGRRDLTAERTEQILAAFERSIAKYGLEGATLERIAEEAGMKRSIIRHYVGNRDELLLVFAESVVCKYREELDEMLKDLPELGRVGAVLDALFPISAAYSAESTLVIEALIAVADRYPTIGLLLQEFLSDYAAALADEFKKEFPNRASKDCWIVAYGVIGLSFNQESLSSLEMPRKYLTASRSCAERLIFSLDAQS